LNSYQAAADKANAEGWVKGPGTVLVGAGLGGWGGTLFAAFKGAIAGAFTSFVRGDDSRQVINSLYSTANSQWQAAGCGSGMYNKYD
jgi:hypothetical protein